VESVRLYRWFQTERNILRKAYLAIQWLKLKSFERSALHRFNASVVVSETDKNLLRKMGISNRLFVVPNGTDTEFFKPEAITPRKDSLVWIGHMDVHTNKDAAMFFWRDIYPLLQEKQPQIHMTFVGSAPPKEIVHASQKDRMIKVTGFVEDIRPFVQRAAIMVVPIRIGSGTRLKILDGMAMGKAIVTTSIGCEGLNVTNRKNISIADTPETFAQNTIELLNNDLMRIKIEAEARKFAKTYDWRLIVDRQEAVYQYLAKGCRG
jgi:glycosyltransferase involved in cell wall biosynthesis